MHHVGLCAVVRHIPGYMFELRAADSCPPSYALPLEHVVVECGLVRSTEHGLRESLTVFIYLSPVRTTRYRFPPVPPCPARPARGCRLPRGRNRVFKGNQANCAPKMVLSGSHDLLKTPEVHDTTACSNISDTSIYSCGLCHRVRQVMSRPDRPFRFPDRPEDPTLEP